VTRGRLADPLVVNEVEAGPDTRTAVSTESTLPWTPRRSWPKSAQASSSRSAHSASVVASGSRVTHFPAAVVSEVVRYHGCG